MTNSTSQWIEIDPMDTLFFRGTEPMVAGENHEAQTMFPPMPATITGAIRTALLGQHGIRPDKYRKAPGKWAEKYPELGVPEKAGFSVLGPLLSIATIPLYPAPAHWMADLKDENRDGDAITVQAGEVLTNTLPGLCGSVAKPFWIVRPSAADMQPLAGYWVTGTCFDTISAGRGKITLRENPQNLDAEEAAVIPLTALLQREERVGIALNSRRTVKEGHLYSTQHIRLLPDVNILVAMVGEYPCSLRSEGILQLGGEQRMCRYTFVAAPDLPHRENGKLFFALAPLPAELPETLKDNPRASGKLLRVGGWDMAKRFHKPLSAWYPAGTVIVKENAVHIPPACITI